MRTIDVKLTVSEADQIVSALCVAFATKEHREKIDWGVVAPFLTRLERGLHRLQRNHEEKPETQREIGD